MEICSIKPGQFYEPCVVALGNFDGVHLGHQKLFEIGAEIAKVRQVKLAVLLFDPHPFKVLYPERKLYLLTGKKERLEVFEEYGVDKVFILSFTPELASASPREFVESILLKICCVHIVVGFNYSFGAKGAGTPQDLEEFGKEYGFGLNIIEAQKLKGRIISSTEIRRNLLNGEISLARDMMGRSPKLAGKVIKGDERGRIMGYPTANIQIDEDLLIPKNGVYTVTSEINGKSYGGMMNIGVRPTFTSGQEKTVEVNFFNYSGNLYDRELIIVIEQRLRSERKFNGMEEIISQLSKDKEQALRVLNQGRQSAGNFTKSV